jgi:hypothetical protein
MNRSFIALGTIVLLGGFVSAGPAFALSPSRPEAAPRVILVGDEENSEVWQDLRPDVAPPPAAVGKKEEPRGSIVEEPKGESGSGNIENKEIWQDLETGVTPPPGE